jgi:hypothetical protein
VHVFARAYACIANVCVLVRLRASVSRKGGKTRNASVVTNHWVLGTLLKDWVTRVIRFMSLCKREHYLLTYIDWI